MPDAPMVASMEAHVSQLKREIKTLTQERDVLLEWHRYKVIPIIQGEIDGLREQKITFEQQVHRLEQENTSLLSLIEDRRHRLSLLDEDIKAASLTIARLVRDKKDIQESIDALDDKLVLLRAKDSTYRLIEGTISKLLQASKETKEELIKMQAEIAEHHRKMREDRSSLIDEQARLAKEKKKVDDYYKKVKGMEGAVHVREENVRRQELMQRGRNIPSIIKKLNGKL